VKPFFAALWAETIKARRSKAPLFTALGFTMAPLAGGLFMIILKDPQAARSMGLISTKAQIMVGAADWPAYFDMLTQAVGVGGAILFAIVTIWIFGREFSDHTAKELMALPTSRETVVAAKFIVVAVWTLSMTLFIFAVGLVVGTMVDIPGWSVELVSTAFGNVLGTAALTIPLMSFVAFVASAGRGYLPPFGWTIFTLALANIAAIMGWGDWFPWSVPMMFSGAAGAAAGVIGIHSYVALTLVSLAGLAATFIWWRSADQTR
jgi:ABC-2 type transport system permease protein